MASGLIIEAAYYGKCESVGGADVSECLDVKKQLQYFVESSSLQLVTLSKSGAMRTLRALMR
jgi:hypothetical protein